MSDKDVSQDILNRYKKVGSATVWTAVYTLRGIKCHMETVKPLTRGMKIASRARTLRSLPIRPDLREEVITGENAPEYIAMGSCGPGDVLVIDAMNIPFATHLGDVKLLHLLMQKADGVVTDGAIRDLEVVRTYGFAVFGQNQTPTATDCISVQANVDIQCSGVLVRPGDIIVGDDEGVVVVPKHLALEVLEWVEEHEEAEEYVKKKILAENCPPGKYYPPTDETIKEMRQAQN